MTTTTIRWAPTIPIGLALTLAGLAVLAFVLLRRVAGGPLAPARRWGLRALRGAILLALLAILLNPVRVEETPGPVDRPRVSYLIDASQSMALGQAGRTRWDQVAATIRDADAARAGGVGPEVAAFRFGSRLAAIDPPSRQPGGPAAAAPAEPPPAPTDADTMLAASLETLAGRFGQAPPRAVVVFSDGRARDAERVGPIARGFGRMKIPIHVVPAGERRGRRRCGHRQHGRAQPGPQVDADPGPALRPELRL